MFRMHFVRSSFICVAVLMFPVVAAGQSAIAGQVRDNTGGALPGATVVASSPALIEGSRTVVTDGQGRYSIIDLRPGVYAVSISLEGFGKVVREGVELPSNFTATLDASLEVGALQESVTVTGGSPVVDVQQAQRTQVLSRQVLDSVVTAGNTWTQAGLVAGVTMTGSDVGGSRYTSDLLLEAHGANARHTVYTIDGMNVNSFNFDGADQNYYQDQANQEISVQTSGGTADVSAGGVRLNMIPKEGGNAFSGSAYFGGSSGAWQSDNFTDSLKAAGLRAIDRVDRIYDYSATQGGPIIRNRLWFMVSGRYWGVNRPVADTFTDDGSQYVTEGNIASVVSRLTLQATPRDKFSVHFDRQAKSTGPKFQAAFPAVITGPGVDPETASTWVDGSSPLYTGTAKWTSMVSSRLLVEAGYATTGTFTIANSQPGVSAPVGSPDWESRVRKTDLNTTATWNGATAFVRKPVRRGVSGSISYVTGSHQLKMGSQVMWGRQKLLFTSNGHIDLVQYRSGVPDSVTVGNYPSQAIMDLDKDLGVYAQDQWTVNRLTINGGVRVEWLSSSVPEQQAGAGRFVAAQAFQAVPDVPNWGPNIVPRLGLAYDLFGNAQTAIKFSIGKYMTPHTTSLSERVNPLSVTTASLPWNDRDLQGGAVPTNGDDIVQNNELDLTRLPANFGRQQRVRIDPDLERESNIETAVSVQHALLSNVSVSAGWYRRSFKNQYIDDNIHRDFSDYVPVQIVSPYNGEVITSYNLRSASELSLVDTVVTNARSRDEVYNGYEFAVQARLPRGGTLLASSVTQRSITRRCDNPDDPNSLRFCDRFDLPAPYNAVPFRSDLKLAGSYELPLGIRVSANFTSMPGRIISDLEPIDESLPLLWNISRTTRYTAADCAGRPCTAGALVIPDLVETSLVVPLAPAGTERRLPRQNQLNLGVSKVVRVGRLEIHPQLNVYNSLNADTVIAERSANFGTAFFAVPSSVLLGRLMRLAVQLRW